MDEKKRQKLLKSIKPGKSMVVFGIIGAFLGELLGAMAGNGNESLFVIFMLVGAAIGVGVGYIFFEQPNKRKRTYLTCIETHQMTSLDEISSVVNQPYETVKKEIESMISKGFFPNVIVDNNSRSLMLPSAGGRTTPQAIPETMKKCPTCGAPCKVSAANNICEYCGTVLS